MSTEVTPIRPDVKMRRDAILDREAIDRRLEKVREDLFAAVAIVNVTRHSLDDRDGANDIGEPEYARALIIAEELFNDVAGRLESVDTLMQQQEGEAPGD